MSNDNREFNNDVLRRMDQEVKVREFFEAMGCSDRQCDVAVRSFGKDEKTFKWTGAALMWVQPGGVLTKAAFDPQCREFLEREYDFLLPPKKPVTEFGEQNVTIDSSVVDQALSGSLTAKGQIARAFGADNTNSAASVKAAQTTDLFLKAERAKRGGGGGGDYDSHATNPWAPIPGNINMASGRYTDECIRRQMSVVRGMGLEKAAQISSAVSAKLGDLYAPGFTNRGR